MINGHIQTYFSYLFLKFLVHKSHSEVRQISSLTKSYTKKQTLFFNRFMISRSKLFINDFDLLSNDLSFFTCVTKRWFIKLQHSNVQKQPSKCVLSKWCFENMQQIYSRTPMPKYDFNKVALQLY